MDEEGAAPNAPAGDRRGAADTFTNTPGSGSEPRLAASVTDAAGGPQAAQGGEPWPVAEAGGDPLAHVVLYQPEIAQNAGNIGRTCVATRAVLWIVRPAGFRLDDRHLRRAALDYWQHLDLRPVDHWQELGQRLPTQPFWYFSRHASRTLWEAPLARGDVLVFGSESAGLPPSILQGAGDRALRLPTTSEVRSLNLATTVGIALYELVRREARLRKLQ